jgi:hypothetical protein
MFVEAQESNLKRIVHKFGLKRLTWNSEGFKDPGKHLFVKESICEYHLDFIALLETGRSNFSILFLHNLVVGKDFH